MKIVLRIFIVILFIVAGIMMLWSNSLQETSHEDPSLTAVEDSENTTPEDTVPKDNISEDKTTNPDRLTWSMKLVNEDVSDQDLLRIRDLGIDIISGEWGVDEVSIDELLSLLDRVHDHDLKLIINFSDGAGWGYREDGTDSPTQKPVWQKTKVTKYIQAVKNHPAVYAYDISNEAGENLPNGEISYESDTGTVYRITLNQLHEASAHVRSLDSDHPIMMRMHYWDEYDGDFTELNPFSSGIVDIVMLNLYSNYTDNGKDPLLPNMIADSGQVLVDKVRKIDPNVDIWLALGAFEEQSLFIMPSTEDLLRDINASRKITGVTNIGFFGWGPERYPTLEGKTKTLHNNTAYLELIQENIQQ